MNFIKFDTTVEVEQVLLACFILLLIYMSNRWKFYKLSLKLPTKWGLPFVGEALELMPIKRFLQSFDKNFHKLKTSTYITWIGMNPFIVTVDPDVIASILSSTELLNKSERLYKPIDNAISEGIITSKVSKWHNNRKLMNSSFTFKTLINFLPIFNRGSQKAVNKLEKLIGQDEQLLFHPIKRVVLAIAIETTLGIKINDGDATNKSVVNGFNFMLEKCAQDVVYPSFIVHTPQYFRTIEFLRNFAQNLVTQKISLKETRRSEKCNNNNISLEANSDIFIDRAVEFLENGKFSMQDVISESHTMIAGSFDTVSTSIFSVVLMLAMHPIVQEKVFNEIFDVFPQLNFDVEYEHLYKLPYLDMVINETLRLMPSIPMIGRHVVRDTVIAHGILLPKGMQIIIPIYNLHRRKDIWGPDADVFNPENFLPENIAQRHAYAYIPFSKGKRNCIGIRYANISMRVMLIKLLRNFKFSTTFRYEDLKFVTNVSLRYEVEPTISVQRRT